MYNTPPQVPHPGFCLLLPFNTMKKTLNKLLFTHVQRDQRLLKRHSRDHSGLRNFSRHPPFNHHFKHPPSSCADTFYSSTTFIWISHLPSGFTSLSMYSLQHCHVATLGTGSLGPNPTSGLGSQQQLRVQGQLLGLVVTHPVVFRKPVKLSAALGQHPSVPVSMATTFSLRLPCLPLHNTLNSCHAQLKWHLLPEACPNFPTQNKYNCLLFSIIWSCSPFLKIRIMLCFVLHGISFSLYASANCITY